MYSDTVPTLHSNVNTLSMFKNILTNEFSIEQNQKMKRKKERDQNTESDEIHSL